MLIKTSRRSFLKTAGIGTASLASLNRWPYMLGRPAADAADIIEIKIEAYYRYARWAFEPAGLYIKPGQRVRWVCQKWGGSVTAFHPAHDNRELRIPEGAKPFESGILLERETPRIRFEWVFDVEGTYDYYSRRHERIGAVGRIIVGRPGGPGEKPLGYGESEGRAPIFPTVKRVLAVLSSERIMKEKVVPYPLDIVGRNYPLQESHF